MIFDKKIFIDKVDVLMNKIFIQFVFSGLVTSFLLNVISLLVAWYMVAELDWNVVKTLISYYLIINSALYFLIFITKLSVSLLISVVLNAINFFILLLTIIYTGDYFMIAYILILTIILIRVYIGRKPKIIGEIFEDLVLVISDQKSKWNYLPVVIIILRIFFGVFTDYADQDIELFISAFGFYSFMIFMVTSLITLGMIYSRVIRDNFIEHELKEISFLKMIIMMIKKDFKKESLIDYFESY